MKENPYRAPVVDASERDSLARSASLRWPSHQRTALLAIVLSATVSIAVFISLSASFGSAFEFFQNGGILHYASASLVHVIAFNAIGAFSVCFGIQLVFPVPARRPGWIVAAAVHIFAFLVANLIDDQQLVASRQVLFLTPASFLVPVMIWVVAFILAATSIKMSTTNVGKMR